LNGVALLCLSALGALPSTGAQAPEVSGYTRTLLTLSDDSLRSRRIELATRPHRAGLTAGAVIPGYLSARGLPPVRGQFTLTDTGLVFHSADSSDTVFPLVGPVRTNEHGQWRPSAVSLAYVDQTRGHPIYIFRIDAGVFETDDPGPLLEVAAHPVWLDSLRPTQWMRERPLVSGVDSAALRQTAQAIATGSFADSLYALFGRPRAAIGLVGWRGRAAGRLGEYIASHDSLALDPARMTGETQLRHTLVHELGHRWQIRSRAQLSRLWSGVPPIRDPKRYGYGDPAEQQAEAIAFAISFLQITASTSESSASSLILLDRYELLVPGTRTMVRYLSLQPIYHKHPLRSLVSTGRT
jgi:hypothetical protein